MSNKFVVIEGPDGSGKSTLSALLLEELQERGIPCQAMREPGGTPLGESIRKILQDPDMKIGSRAETLLFCAARAELSQQIRQALRQSWVLLDRFEGSTAVYQGIVRELGREEVLQISRWSSGDLVPDYTLVVEVSEETARRRRDARGTADRMENTTDLQKTLEGYAWLAGQPGHTPISGEGTPEEALREALRVLGLEKK